jgi:hypothetical protein
MGMPRGKFFFPFVSSAYKIVIARSALRSVAIYILTVSYIFFLAKFLQLNNYVAGVRDEEIMGMNPMASPGP